MHFLLDAGSVSALLLALERAAIRIPWIPVRDATAPRRNVAGYLRRYHAILHDQRNERLIMIDETAPKTDPYAGARAMGIQAPPVEDPHAEAEAPQTSGVDDTDYMDDTDYAAYLKWKASQGGTSIPEGGPSTPENSTPNVTVTPAAKFTAPDSRTPVGAYLDADVTAAANTVEAVAPGLVTRLKSVLADHQSLVSELEELIAEAEKF